MKVYQVFRDDLSIQGDHDDPFQLSSYSLLTGKAVDQAREVVKDHHPDLEVRELQEDDVEEPEIIIEFTAAELAKAQAFVSPDAGHAP